MCQKLDSKEHVQGNLNIALWNITAPSLSLNVELSLLLPPLKGGYGVLNIL